MTNVININGTELFSNYTEDELLILSGFLSEFFYGMLKPLKPEHITYYAQHNTGIDPRRYIHSLPNEIRSKIRNVLHNNPQLLDVWLTYDKFLENCKKKREDLYNCLINPEYKKWFNKQIWVIKQAIKTI